MSETSSGPSEQAVEPASASSAQLPPIDPLRAGVESILLVVDTPVAAEDMARALDVSASDVRDVLREIEYESVSYTHLTLPTM